MYIDKVTLKNIKGFEDLEFSLTRGNDEYAGWTVFTGDNGAGKSTLLKAIAVALTGKDTARSLQPSFHRWIREGAGEQEAQIELMIAPEKGVDEFSSGGRISDRSFPATITLKNLGKETSVEIPEAVKGKKTPAQRGLWSTDAHGWFSCGYGPFRRVFWSFAGGNEIDGGANDRTIRNHVSGGGLAVRSGSMVAQLKSQKIGRQNRRK